MALNLKLIQFLQSGIPLQIWELLSSGEQAKLKAAMPKIIAGAIKGALANIVGGQTAMEAGALTGAIQAGIEALGVPSSTPTTNT